MSGPHALAYYVDRSRRIAEAAQRRVEGRPRPATVVETELGSVLSKLAATDAEALALADTLKLSIAAGLERLRHVRLGQDFHAVQREVDLQNRRVAYEMRSAIAEAKSLRALADALRAELADAHARPL